jgi:hypothetical protein
MSGLLKDLVLEANAFVKMIRFMSEFANFTTIPQPNWVEAMGIMFCKETAESYIIVDAEGLTSGTTIAVETSPQHIAQIVASEERRQAKDKRVFMGGWFHSHPGLGIFYSGTDINNQSYWQQNNPNGVGMVFDLTKVSANFLGIRFFRLDSANSTNYFEVDYLLKDFTEDTLIDAFSPIGIDAKTIHQLALFLNIEAKEGVVEFDKIEIPETDDPHGLGKKYIEVAESLLKEGDTNKCLEKYRIATSLLEKTDAIDLYADAALRLAELCVYNEYFGTAQQLIEKLSITPHLKDKSYVLGKGEILSGYIADFEKKTGEAQEHYEKARKYFEVSKFYEGCYLASDLSAGASWKLSEWDNSIEYFKKAREYADRAEKSDHPKNTKKMWNVIKKGLDQKIKSAEGEPFHSGVEKIA